LLFEIEIDVEGRSKIRIQVVQYHFGLSNQIILRIACVLHIYMHLWVTHCDQVQVHQVATRDADLNLVFRAVYTLLMID